MSETLTAILWITYLEPRGTCELAKGLLIWEGLCSPHQADFGSSPTFRIKLSHFDADVL